MVLNGVTLDRLTDRRALLGSLDKFRRDVDSSGLMEGLDTFNEQAFGVLTSSKRYFTGAWLSDRLDRKRTIAVCLLGGAAAAFCLSQSTTPPTIMVSGALLSFFLNGSIAATYAYTPELFPTWTRTTATGLASAFGRLGSISAPAIIGFASSSLGFAGVFGMTCAVLVAGVVGVLVFGVSTAGHSLEQLNERAPEPGADRPSRLAT